MTVSVVELGAQVGAVHGVSLLPRNAFLLPVVHGPHMPAWRSSKRAENDDAKLDVA